MDNNTIIENENILNNNDEQMNMNLNMENVEENINLNNITGDDENREEDGDMKDDLLDSTMENDNLGNALDGDNELNDLNDDMIEQNNMLKEDNYNNNNNEMNNLNNNHNNDEYLNENKTIVEDDHNKKKENIKNNHSNENTTLIHGSLLSPITNNTDGNNNDVKNEFNKRNIELEVEQLTKQRRLLEEERRKISEQIVYLEKDDDEPPELSLSQCNTILNKLKKNHEQIIWPFLEPVDHVKHRLTDYLEIVKTPMDLGTIAFKIKKKEYASYYGFVADLNLVWDNCILYNTEHTDIGRWAVDLKESSDTMINDALKKKADDKKKNFGVKGKAVSQVDEVKAFIERIRLDPTTLKQPKFQFFKDFLSSFDVNKI